MKVNKNIRHIILGHLPPQVIWNFLHSHSTIARLHQNVVYVVVFHGELHENVIELSSRDFGCNLLALSLNSTTLGIVTIMANKRC